MKSLTKLPVTFGQIISSILGGGQFNFFVNRIWCKLQVAQMTVPLFAQPRNVLKQLYENMRVSNEKQYKVSDGNTGIFG